MITEQQRVEFAISEALRIGGKFPRRWLAQHGGLVSCRGDGAKELNKAYRQHRKVKSAEHSAEQPVSEARETPTRSTTPQPQRAARQNAERNIRKTRRFKCMPVFIGNGYIYTARF